MAITVIIGLALLIIIHEAGHFAAAKFFGIRVDEFGFGFPPRIFSKKSGETEYSLNALPIGGFVRLAHEDDDAPDNDPRSFSSQSLFKKICVLVAGIVANLLVAWGLLSLVFSIGAPLRVVVSDVAPASPAAIAGVMSGDIISDFKTTDEFISFSQKETAGDKPITFSVQRGSLNIPMAVTGRKNPPPGEGSIGVALVGVGFRGESFFSAILSGAQATYETFLSVAGGVYDLIVNAFSRGSLSSVAGPVGIVAMASNVGSAGFTYILQLIAVISINLAALNLVPFPALDGGRALIAIISKLSGHRIPKAVERGVNGIGFALLLVLMVLVTIQDIRRLV